MDTYSIERQGKQCLVLLHGDLTSRVTMNLQAALKTELADGVGDIVFDLGNTVMLDSSGIGLLIASSNSMTSRKGSMRVLNASSEILQLLQKMRLVARLNVSGR